MANGLFFTCPHDRIEALAAAGQIEYELSSTCASGRIVSVTGAKELIDLLLAAAAPARGIRLYTASGKELSLASATAREILTFRPEQDPVEVENSLKAARQTLTQPRMTVRSHLFELLKEKHAPIGTATLPE